MATAKDMARRAEARVAELTASVEARKAEFDALLEGAESESRDLSDAENERVDALFAEIEKDKAERGKQEVRLANYRKMAEEDEAARSAPEPPSAPTAEFRVGAEPHTFDKVSDPTGRKFLADVITSQLYGDRSAGDRIQRHMHEDYVDRTAKGFQSRTAGTAGAANTDNFGAIVVPQYLLDMTAPAVAAGRPLADICNHHPLPADGMTVTIPTITTATSVALQSAQLDDVSHTSLAETDLVLNVQTAAGRQNVSLQALQRGTGVESIVMQDLVKRYNTTLDSTLINGTTYGLLAKAVGTLGAYADTTPTGAELYPKVLAAASGVEAILLSQAQPSHVVMHSRRWYWLAKEMTSTWPLINSQGLEPRTGGSLDPNSSYNKGVRGILPNGLLVVVDNNVPTNVTSDQDPIFVVPQDECHLFEEPGSPMYIRAEQPLAANLGVQLVVYGFFAYTFDRYGAGSMQKIVGTGLALANMTW
jgi:Phage capsid family